MTQAQTVTASPTTSTPSTFAVGDTLAVEFTLTNPTSATVNLHLRNVVPWGTTYNAGASTAGWSCPNANWGYACIRTISVPANGSSAITLAFTVTAPIQSNVIISNLEARLNDASGQAICTGSNCRTTFTKTAPLLSCLLESSGAASGTPFPFAPFNGIQVTPDVTTQQLVGLTEGKKIWDWGSSSNTNPTQARNADQLYIWKTRGNPQATFTFNPPVPANSIGLVISDVGDTNSTTDYAPTIAFSVTGGTTNPASLSDFKGSDVGGISSRSKGLSLVYDPADGSIQRLSSDTSAYGRRFIALLGQGSNLVSSISLTGTGFIDTDLVDLSLVAIPTCVTLQKISHGGVGTFDFSHAGLNAETSSLTTTSVDQAVVSTRFTVNNPLANVTVSETLLANPPWRLDTAAEKTFCTDRNDSSRAALTGASGSQLTLPASALTPTSDWLCTFTNYLVNAVEEDPVNTDVNTPIDIDLLANDGGDAITVTSLNGSTCTAFPCTASLLTGTASVTANGMLTFTPNGTPGTVNIPYGITTSTGGYAASAQASITVLDVPVDPNPPVTPPNPPVNPATPSVAPIPVNAPAVLGLLGCLMALGGWRRKRQAPA